MSKMCMLINSHCCSSSSQQFFKSLMVTQYFDTDKPGNIPQGVDCFPNFDNILCVKSNLSVYFHSFTFLSVFAYSLTPTATQISRLPWKLACFSHLESKCNLMKPYISSKLWLKKEEYEKKVFVWNLFFFFWRICCKLQLDRVHNTSFI